MKQLLLVLTGLVIVGLVVAACGGVMQVGPIQVAPAPQIGANAFSNAKVTPVATNALGLAPSQDDQKEKDCRDAKAQWDMTTGNGSTTLNLSDPVFQDLKDLFNKLVLSCGYEFSVVESSKGSGVFVTTVYEKGKKPPESPKEGMAFLADLAKKGKIDDAWKECRKLATFINDGEFVRSSFLILPGDSDEVKASKQKIFDALEKLGGPICSRWFTVKVYGGVFTIFDK